MKSGRSGRPDLAWTGTTRATGVSPRVKMISAPSARRYVPETGSTLVDFILDHVPEERAPAVSVQFATWFHDHDRRRPFVYGRINMKCLLVFIIVGAWALSIFALPSVAAESPDSADATRSDAEKAAARAADHMHRLKLLCPGDPEKLLSLVDQPLLAFGDSTRATSQGSLCPRFFCPPFFCPHRRAPRPALY